MDNGAGAEFGVVALNYRRQLVGNTDAAVIVSPRLSLFADVGTAGKSPYALQVNVPVTAVLSGSFVSHWNLGGTVGDGARNRECGSQLSSGWHCRG